MVSGGLNCDGIAPKILIIPNGEGRLSGAYGEIFQSGAKLFICDASNNPKIITSA